MIRSDPSTSPEEKTALLESLTLRDSTVADLVLDFLLPGTDVELKDGGREIQVDVHNLEEYVELVIEWTLRRGIMLQLKEFKSGFSSGMHPFLARYQNPLTDSLDRTVFPVRDLQSFTPSELVMMTSAIDEDWSVECASFLPREMRTADAESPSATGLTSCTKADHGFTMDSRPVRDVLSIMSQLSLDERREFLSFITGSSVVPFPILPMVE